MSREVYTECDQGTAAAMSAKAPPPAAVTPGNDPRGEPYKPPKAEEVMSRPYGQPGEGGRFWALGPKEVEEVLPDGTKVVHVKSHFQRFMDRTAYELLDRQGAARRGVRKIREKSAERGQNDGTAVGTSVKEPSPLRGSFAREGSLPSPCNVDYTDYEVQRQNQA